MRITILVNHDPAAALALHYLLPKLATHQLQIFYTKKKPSIAQATPLARLAEFEQSLLNNPVRPKNPHALVNAQLINDINRADFLCFKNTRPDLVISIRHMSILKPAVIALPELGVINLHSGCLPRYQGVMASFWAMKNREPSIGTSLHFIEDETIDTGSIITRTKTPTRFDRSYLWNTFNIYRQGCDALLSAVAKLSRGDSLSRHSQVGEAQYYSFPNEHDIADFNHPLFERSDNWTEFSR